MRIAAAAAAVIVASAATAVPFLARLHQGVLDLPVLRAVDGDTIAVHATPGGPTVGYLRLWGIDAPEITTEAGRTAQAALADLLRDGGIRCVAVATGGYGRMAVRCHTNDGDGPDIARLLVESGLAHDCPAFSHGYYERFENERTRALPPARQSCGNAREGRSHGR